MRQMFGNQASGVISRSIGEEIDADGDIIGGINRCEGVAVSGDVDGTGTGRTAGGG